jgi:hypothetical protein
LVLNACGKPGQRRANWKPGIWVRFSQFGELPEGDAEQAQAGMESYFDSLGIFLNSK